MIELDHQVFYFVNNVLSNSFIDPLMVAFRNPYVWLPAYVFLLSFVVLNFRKQAYWYILFLLIMVSSTDYVSSSIIKQSVKRYRPCHQEVQLQDLRLLVHCGSGYSFTSTHATNHFGLAFFLIFTFGIKKKYIFIPLFFWAALISYAQVYVGVHFPLDVICGGLLGIVIAFLISELYKISMRKMNLKPIAL